MTFNIPKGQEVTSFDFDVYDESMTREEAVRILNVYASVNGSGQCTQDEFEIAKRIAIKALEADSDDYARGYKQDMMNNLIRRQDAIELINEYLTTATQIKNKDMVDALEDMKDDFVNLPSAQPDRSLRFRIGEICVDESKGFISSGRAVEKIRELLRETERREEEE